MREWAVLRMLIVQRRRRVQKKVKGRPRRKPTHLKNAVATTRAIQLETPIAGKAPEIIHAIEGILILHRVQGLTVIADAGYMSERPGPMERSEAVWRRAMPGHITKCAKLVPVTRRPMRDQ